MVARKPQDRTLRGNTTVSNMGQYHDSDCLKLLGKSALGGRHVAEDGRRFKELVSVPYGVASCCASVGAQARWLSKRCPSVQENRSVAREGQFSGKGSQGGLLIRVRVTALGRSRGAHRCTISFGGLWPRSSSGATATTTTCGVVSCCLRAARVAGHTARNKCEHRWTNASTGGLLGRSVPSNMQPTCSCMDTMAVPIGVAKLIFVFCSSRVGAP